MPRGVVDGTTSRTGTNASSRRSSTAPCGFTILKARALTGFSKTISLTASSRTLPITAILRGESNESSSAHSTNAPSARSVPPPVTNANLATNLTARISTGSEKVCPHHPSFPCASNSVSSRPSKRLSGPCLSSKRSPMACSQAERPGSKRPRSTHCDVPEFRHTRTRRSTAPLIGTRKTGRSRQPMFHG